MSLQNSPYIVGSGARKVICLNGWFGHARGWGAFTDCLDGDEFTYAFLDYRGYGSRRNSGGPYTVVQMAQDGEALADQLGWHAFALLGHGMGGGVAQYLLSCAPERVQALVAVASVSPHGAALAETDRAKLLAEAPVAHVDPVAFEAYLAAWNDLDFSERLQGKTTPVLIITGAHDAGFGVETRKGSFKQYYPNLEEKVLANAGHYPMYEVPAEFAALLEEYLVQHMPR